MLLAGSNQSRPRLPPLAHSPLPRLETGAGSHRVANQAVACSLDNSIRFTGCRSGRKMNSGRRAYRDDLGTAERPIICYPRFENWPAETLPPPRIATGLNVLHEFLDAVRLPLDDAVILFDYHKVADTFTRENSIALGVDLDHIEGATGLFCSKGARHIHEVYNAALPHYPLLAECDFGAIFTSCYDAGRNPVHIYRTPGMPRTAICITGDKGQAAALLQRPCVLLDDKEDNIDAMRRHCTRDFRLDGALVFRGRRHRSVIPRAGYGVIRTMQGIQDTIRDFSNSFSNYEPIVRHSGLNLELPRQR